MAMAASDLDRAASSLAADDPAVSDLVDSDTAFALDLYRELVAGDPDANVFLSPYSLSVALGMTLPGTRGDTFDQLAAALGASDSESWHEARNGLDRLLVDRDGDLELNVANALFGQADYELESEFLDLLARHYGAGMHLLDFRNAPEPSRATINDWVADRTEDLFPELLGEGSISADTRLVLANAIYFRGEWRNQFSERRTEEADFTTGTGDVVTVDMMRNDFETSIGASDGWRAARLPYEDGASMLVILPDDFDDFAATFDGARLAEIRSAMEWGDLRLQMPRFELDIGLSVVEPLERLGVVDLFEPPTPVGGADLTGMTERRELFVSDVIHQAVITVDEEGTEAAAASAVVVDELTALPPDLTLDLTLDRPFLFLIQDDATGAILFVGHLTDPGASAS